MPKPLFNVKYASNAELLLSSFKNVVPLSKASPERNIRNLGRERAVPANGQPIGGGQPTQKSRRVVLI